MILPLYGFIKTGDLTQNSSKLRLNVSKDCFSIESDT